MIFKNTRIGALDCETDPFLEGRVPEPFCVGYHDHEHSKVFWGKRCIVNMVNWLHKTFDDNLIVYVHNGGNFDFHFFVEHFRDELLIINNRIAQCKLSDTIEFRDSFLILPLPLAAYQKDKVDYDIFEKELRNNKDNKRLITEYLRSDCRYLYEWCCKFIQRFGLHVTLPSASFQAMKQSGYKLTRSTEYYDSVFRPFYYGGRTQAFEGGEHRGIVDYYDINSAYPDAMQYEHPHGMRYTCEYDITLKEALKGADFVVINAVSRGALPVRRDDGSLDYPDDDQVRAYKVTGWELRAGVETGTLDVHSVDEAYFFEHHESMKPFVDKYYSAKLAAKEAHDSDGELFNKLIQNSGYGKLALNAAKFKKNVITLQGFLPDELVDCYEYYQCRNTGELLEVFEACTDEDERIALSRQLSWNVVKDMHHGVTIWERDQPGDKYFNVATAASITGYVRANLWRHICKSSGVLYCDTDSIMARSFNGTVSKALGHWSKECSFDQLWIAGKKNYAGLISGSSRAYPGPGAEDFENDYFARWVSRNWKCASKGSRLTPEQIIYVALGGVISWSNKAPSFSLRYGARFTTRDIRRTV